MSLSRVAVAVSLLSTEADTHAHTGECNADFCVFTDEILMCALQPNTCANLDAHFSDIFSVSHK